MTNKYRRPISILLLLALLFTWQPGLVQAADGDLTLTASKDPVDGNEHFTISVKVEAPADLYGVQFSLTYDDTKLNILNVSAGSVWPVGDSFVARATATGGGTDSENIEFAATLKSGDTIGDGEVVSILVEVVNPTTQMTTTIGAGSSLALLFSDAAGQSLAATAPDDLIITVNPAPQVTGTVTLQSPGTTPRQSTVQGVNISGQDSQFADSGVQFSLNLPTTAGSVGTYTLTASANCHLSAEKDSVVSPSTGNDIILLAGDVNGDNRVNIQDLSAMGNLFGSPPTASLPCTDLNQDGTVNILDLSRAASNYGEQGPLDW